MDISIHASQTVVVLIIVALLLVALVIAYRKNY